MHDVITLDLGRIAQDLQIRKVQVESVVQLLDEGNTVPFITRYRKERTGGLNEEVIRTVQSRVGSLRQLADRKQSILKSIENQGKLTDDLRAAIVNAETPKRLEDLYLPYKPKKRTLATTARERGLEPFALAIWNRDPAVANLHEVLPTLVNPEKELPTPVEILAGAQHILAELIAETAENRSAMRMFLWDTARLTTAKNETLAEGQGLDFKDYFQFAEPIRHIPPHRILAINRGEKEGSLKVRLEFELEIAHRVLLDKLPLADHPHADFLKTVADDSLNRLLLPSLEREIRRELTERSESHAVSVFARNLRSLLLQPPLQGCRVLAIDPGFRTGCKLAALDEHGNLLADGVIFPHPPQNKKNDAKTKLEELVRRFDIHVIAIGNGTACRETEEVVSELIAQLKTGQPVGGTEGKELGGLALITASASFSTGGAVIVSDMATAISELPPLPPPESLPLSGVSVSMPSFAPMMPPPELPAVIVPAEPPTSDVAASTSSPGAAESAIAPPATATDAPAAPPESVPTPDAEPAATPAPSAEITTSPPPETPTAPIDHTPFDLAYVIVNEAGASVYSASPVGREEFPDYDATLRGTISIGRRLQDPLSELVKIDPQSIGVGLYQHDVNPRHLKDSLEVVIESSVNHVGVDLNTASVPLLRHVSGLNQLVARELVDYRKQNGPFKSREQLMQIPGVGPARYTQAAGFLKIRGGYNPLDYTWIHPESYPIAQRLITDLGFNTNALEDRQQSEALREKLKELSPEEVSTRLEVGVPTIRDILDALARPGRDPREDLPQPIFKKGILKLEDLQPGMELKGTVLNVVDFGAFVDIGLKDSGLVHISQMANRYIKSPYEVVLVGDVVTVWVMAVDQDRRRVSLTMIKPGTERKPPERKPQEQRPPRPNRPPRGARRPPLGHGPVATPKGPRPVPAPSGEGQQNAEPVAGTAASAPPPPQQPARHQAPPPRPTAPPPRRPAKKPPKPKLTQAALQGKAPLRTFSELSVFFEAKDTPDEPPKTETTPPADQGSQPAP